MGAAYEGWTDGKEQGYSFFFPASNFEAALSIIAGISEDPLQGVDANTFEEEKQIIELEYRTRTVDINRALRATIANVMTFGDVQRENDRDNLLGGLRSTTFEQTRDFVKQRFKKNNMTLYLRLPAKYSLTERQKALLGINGLTGSQSVPTTWTNRLATHRDSRSGRAPGDLGTIVANVPENQIWLTWPMKLDNHVDIAQAVTIAIQIRTALTYSNLRPSTVRSADCVVDETSKIPNLSCRIDLKQEGSAKSSTKDVLGWLRSLFNSEFRKQENVEIIAGEGRMNYVMSDETVTAHAMSIVTGIHRSGDPLFQLRIADAMGRLDSGDVYRKAKDLMDEKKVYAMYVTPTSDDTHSKDVPVPRQWQMRDKVANCELPLNYASADIASQAITKKTLANGFEVIVLPIKDSSYATAVFGFRGGRAWADNKEIAFAAELAKNHKRAITPFEKGLSYISIDAVDVQVDVARTTADNTSELIPYVKSEFQPLISWPNKWFLQSYSDFIIFESSLKNRHARELLTATIGNHPYSNFHDLEHVRSVSREQIARYFESLRRPDNGALVVVGNVNTEDIVSAATSAFEDFENPSTPKLEKPRPITPTDSPAGKAKYVVTHLPATNNVSVKLQCVVTLSNSEDANRALLLETLISRQMIAALRFDRTLTYSAKSKTDLATGGFAHLSWDADVPNELFPDFLRTINDSVLPFDERSMSTELSVAIDRRRTAVALSHSSTVNLAQSIFRQWTLGFSVDDVLHIDARLARTRYQDLLPVIAQCKKTMRIGLLGDDSVISKVMTETEKSPIAIQ